MKKRLLCALLALSLLTLPGCKRDPEPVEVTAPVPQDDRLWAWFEQHAPAGEPVR